VGEWDCGSQYGSPRRASCPPDLMCEAEVCCSAFSWAEQRDGVWPCPGQSKRAASGEVQRGPGGIIQNSGAESNQIASRPPTMLHGQGTARWYH
jgi:hypothetical protein